MGRPRKIEGTSHLPLVAQELRAKANEFRKEAKDLEKEANMLLQAAEFLDKTPPVPYTVKEDKAA